MKLKIILSLISYCGIEYNHNKWHSHINKCEICKEKYKVVVEKEKNILNNWNKKCECGCGKVTKYKNNFIMGHGVKNKKQSYEHKIKKLESWKNNGNSEKTSQRLKENNPCDSEKCKERMKNDNPAKKDDVRKKLSENNAMKNQEYIDKIKITKLERYNDENYNNMEKNKLTCLEKYGVDSVCKVKEFIEKRIKTYTERMANGEYKIKNNWTCGEYVRKNGNTEWYDSSFELNKMLEFDSKDIYWTKKHKIRISYINENGLNSYYVPDFLIDDNYNKSIVETKGWIKENDLLKIKSGIEFCKTNNMNYLFYLGSYDKLCEKHSYIKFIKFNY